MMDSITRGSDALLQPLWMLHTCGAHTNINEKHSYTYNNVNTTFQIIKEKLYGPSCVSLKSLWILLGFVHMTMVPYGSFPVIAEDFLQHGYMVLLLVLLLAGNQAFPEIIHCRQILWQDFCTKLACVCVHRFFLMLSKHLGTGFLEQR